MISVGERIELGLGFGGGGEMGEAKIEEGRDWYYYKGDYKYNDDNNDDGVSNIDPDISLSYIDEKLQDVLGHFRKYFEGEVSAEKLGAKFGGYGSFLPTNQRSPVWQSPHTPQKIHSSNIPRSQNIPQLEGVQTCNPVPSSASTLPSRGSTFATYASTNQLKNYANDFLKIKEKMSSAHIAEESISGCKASKYFSQASDKSSKDRIKVNSDNLPTQRNAEESPTSILQIMTSYPVNGNLLLSPLPRDLINFSEKLKIQGESRDKISPQVSDAKHSDRVKGSNKQKSSTKSDFPIEQKKVNATNYTSVYPRKDGHLKGDIATVSVNAQLGVCYEEKARKTEVVYRCKLNASSPEVRFTASERKKKQKESSNMDASLVPMGRKSETVNIVLPKSEVEDSKLRKNLGKVRDTYKDIFGDVELEQDDDVDLEDVISKDRAGEFEPVEKYASRISSKVNSCVKKIDKKYIPGGNHKSAPLVEDNWVCCDKCQKWRLLPLGTNPDNLPEKWICSMLNWLPGMNQCSFSEEETNKLHGSSLIDDSFCDQKKENEVNNVSASTDRDCPVSNSGKNNLKISVKCCSLNGVKPSSLVSEIEIQHLTQAGALEKDGHKQREKKKLLEQPSGRDEITRKRDAEPGRPSVSKKAMVDDDSLIGHGRPSGKVVFTSSRMNQHKSEDHLTSDRKRDKSNKSEDPSRNSNDQSTERKRKIGESPLVHKHGLRETSGSSGSGGSKIHRSIKEQQFVSDKRDLGSSQPSQAISSCSKVSGSHNKRTIPKEMKGSVIESISSSPLGFLNQQDSTSKRRNLDKKDDFGNAPCDEKRRALRNIVQGQVSNGSPENVKEKSKMVVENDKRDDKCEFREFNRLDKKGDDTGAEQKHNLRPDRDRISSKRLLSHEVPLSGLVLCETKKRPLHLISGAENEAKSAFKEGTILKHMADSMKNSGSNVESTSFYFQAALKFLHGAFLLESCKESVKRGEITMSMELYSSTAKLCKFLALEYEKSKDFSAAALAYKLAEVAYMRVVYSSNTNASEDCHEVQTALQMVPLGSESPSSSASDIDNLNNPATIGKGSLVNGFASPQVIGIYNIVARNRVNVSRILHFAEDVNYAIDASRNSRNAFAAANSKSNKSQGREALNSVKKALDFNFQDVEELLKLVRQAMDAISR